MSVEAAHIQWNCNLSKSSELTVGELLTLSCDGPTDGIDKDSLQLKDAQLSDEVPALSLLQIKNFESNKAEFIVTSYRTGEHKSNEVVFYDGKNKIDVTGVEWKLNSVIKQDPANPPQAFGSFPMASISYPVWFWILLVVVLISAIGLPYLQYKKIRNRKRDFDDLRNLEIALNPLDAFFKSTRRMEKALEIGHVSPRGFVDQVDKDLRIYLSRSLQLPAHLWKINVILKEIKRKHPRLYRDHGVEIKKYFSEFTKLKGEVQKKDGIYLMELAQKLTEAVDEATSKKRGAR
jgi:hypothetical protein